MTSGWSVFDLATQSMREDGLTQAAAEQLADELNQDNRIYPEPRTVRVLVGTRWRFGKATAWCRRDGRWSAYVKPDRVRASDWYPEACVHEPDGVFAARR